MISNGWIMKNNRLLEKINSVSEFKELLKADEFSEVLTSGMADEEVITKSFLEMDSFDKEQEKHFLRYMHFVDTKLSSKMKFSVNRKLMTILIGSIYIGDYYDKVRDYDLLHLMSISFFSIFDSVEMLDENIKIFSEEIFKCYKEKTNDFMYYVSFNEVVRDLHDSGKNEEEIINYLRDKTSTELIRKSAARVEKIAEQGGFSI